MTQIKIQEVLVVEGRYDVNTLKQVVDASILPTNGFGIFKDKEMQDYLRLLAKRRGLLVLTDSDGAGLVIRNFVKNCVGTQGVKHAYVPEIYGKERRKKQASKQGLLGVEGMRPEVLVAAIVRAGATVLGEEIVTEQAPKLAKSDLFLLGLSGTANSAQKRQILCKTLGIPTNMSANALLDYLNLISDRNEIAEILQKQLDNPSNCGIIKE